MFRFFSKYIAIHSKECYPSLAELLFGMMYVSNGVFSHAFACNYLFCGSDSLMLE